MKKRFKLSAFVFFTLPQLALAAVISSEHNGFKIQIEHNVNADVTTSYQQFIKVGEWWNAEHTYFGKSTGMTLIPKAGGCFCETSGDKEVLHMTVSYVDPNKELRMIGGLGPLQMMGVQGGMNWQFKKIDDKHAKIIHTYQVVGYMAGGLDKLAAIVDKVQTLQVKALVNKIEAG